MNNTQTLINYTLDTILSLNKVVLGIGLSSTIKLIIPLTVTIAILVYLMSSIASEFGKREVIIILCILSTGTILCGALYLNTNYKYSSYKNSDGTYNMDNIYKDGKIKRDKYIVYKQLEELLYKDIEGATNLDRIEITKLLQQNNIKIDNEKEEILLDYSKLMPSGTYYRYYLKYISECDSKYLPYVER